MTAINCLNVNLEMTDTVLWKFIQDISQCRIIQKYKDPPPPLWIKSKQEIQIWKFYIAFDAIESEYKPLPI